MGRVQPVQKTLAVGSEGGRSRDPFPSPGPDSGAGFAVSPPASPRAGWQTPGDLLAGG